MISVTKFYTGFKGTYYIGWREGDHVIEMWWDDRVYLYGPATVYGIDPPQNWIFL